MFFRVVAGRERRESDAMIPQLGTVKRPLHSLQTLNRHQRPRS